MKGKRILFLKNVLLFTLTSFGGAQAHLGLLLKYFVKNSKFISEEDLLELNALSQLLPGPASTQTLVGIGYKVGGLKLAIITFFIWVLPSAIIMTFAAISITMFDEKSNFSSITKYIQPIALGIVAYGGFQFASKVLNSNVKVFLCIATVIGTLVLQNAYIFPLALLLGGIISSTLEIPIEERTIRFNLFANINPNKLFYFIGVLVILAGLGAVINTTSPFSLPIRLFENFYRNGILVFGGGQVLVPLMFTEFVQMKNYLLSSEFISGYALQQAIPGPTFSFTSFLGALSMKKFGYDTIGQVFGGLIGVIGINLPGLILVLFIVPFWNDLKKITRIKNSLSGINAVSVGFIIAAFFLLFYPIGFNLINIGIVFITFLLLNYTKVNAPIIIIIGALLGYFF
ncbi:chromate efflux transporter [Pedobacter flavus]|uniref:Chromate efflux transporter n=1 Tax=Pedobacter flavus TaxID=3113906 RepID=A0ABU7H365_9SPHI|nr:chromate efflux transporter [Pedobacter sp. VNH31]MEE1885565.1 chromate efflux transporter [Pedobacter sp. VNH31]